MRKRKPAWTRWAGSTTRRWALAIATAWAAIRCSPTPSASRSCPTICAWTHPAPMARSTWCDATTWAAIRSGSTMRRCVLVKYILWILLTYAYIYPAGEVDSAHEHGSVLTACHAGRCQYAAAASMQLRKGPAVADGVQVQVAGSLAGWQRRRNARQQLNTTQLNGSY